MSKDAEKFFINLMNTLATDTTLQGILGVNDGDYAVFPNRFVPVGNVYPQITVCLDFKESYFAFPAAKYDLIIRYWVDDDAGSELGKCWTFRNRMETLLNRAGSDYNEEGSTYEDNLRVAMVLRRYGEFNHDKEHNKYFVDYRFDVTMSEDESPLAADAGDKTWA